MQYFVEFIFVEEVLVDLNDYISLEESSCGLFNPLSLMEHGGDILEVSCFPFSMYGPMNNNMPLFFWYKGFNCIIMLCLAHCDIDVLNFERNPFLLINATIR